MAVVSDLLPAIAEYWFRIKNGISWGRFWFQIEEYERVKYYLWIIFFKTIIMFWPVAFSPRSRNGSLWLDLDKGARIWGQDYKPYMLSLPDSPGDSRNLVKSPDLPVGRMNLPDFYHIEIRLKSTLMAENPNETSPFSVWSTESNMDRRS